VAARDAGLAGRAAADAAALGQQAGARRTVDGPVNTAAAQQAFVGRIDDGVNFQRGDVAIMDRKAHLF